jgi:uncharacterized membrane protein (UPF0127 family)
VLFYGITASHNIKKGPCLVNRFRARYRPESRADIALQHDVRFARVSIALVIQRVHGAALDLSGKRWNTGGGRLGLAKSRRRLLIKEYRLRVFTAVLGLVLWLGSIGTQADPLLTYPLKINGHSIRAEVANSEEDRRTGLMFRKSLAENQGMLFIYEKEGRYAMWMKNTNVPLSVAFIDKTGAILNIEDMEPQTEDSHGSRGAAKFSLEMNQGWFKKRGIKKGDHVAGLERIPRGE